jgi:hypothetical protein
MKPETLGFDSATADLVVIDRADDLMLDERELQRLSDTSAGHAGDAENQLPSAGTSGDEPRRRISLSTLLRGAGGFVIVAAFVTYLFQGWREGDDLTRYLILLAHTGGLTLTGFALGHLLHEPRGARLFVALGLAAVPVNFAFLGGMTYDSLTWDAIPSTAQHAGDWLASAGTGFSPGVVLPLVAGALLLLAFSVWLAFLVMARRSAPGLSAAYLVANAALLVPTREHAAIAASLIGLVLGLAWTVQRLRRRDPSLATAEGLFARLVLMLPLMVLGGRTLWLYAPDAAFLATLSLVGYLGVRQLARAMWGESAGLGALELVAVVLAGACAWLLLVALADTFGLTHPLVLPAAGAALAALLVDIGSLAPRRRSGYRSAASLALVLTAVGNLTLDAGFDTAFIALVYGLGVLGYGYDARQRMVFALGIITALAGLGVIGHEALSAFSVGGWTLLVALGAVTVIAGSVLERHGPALKAAAARWHRRFAPDA